jgi:hypothetical protein
MLPLGLFECCLRLVDRLLGTLPLLRLRGLFFPALAFALPLGSLVPQRGLAG